MAILTKIVADETDWSLWGANIPDRCFTCNKPLHFPLVFWAGWNGETRRQDDLQIWMHPDCARKLGKNLVRDAHKAQHNELTECPHCQGGRNLIPGAMCKICGKKNKTQP